MQQQIQNLAAITNINDKIKPKNEYINNCQDKIIIKKIEYNLRNN